MRYELFSTLPESEIANGSAEAIKTGVLAGETLFGLFESGAAREQMEQVVAQCVAYKARIVEADERDSELRNILNLGHTAGHAIEVCSDTPFRTGRPSPSDLASSRAHPSV